MNDNTSTEATTGELVITRTLEAPRELVFKAWSESERLAQWWGPKGWDIEVRQLEFRPGGRFHYRLSMKDGEMWGLFTYREIVAPERIVYASSFSDPEANTTRAPFSDAFPLIIENTLTFEEDEPGRTTLTLRARVADGTDDELAMFTSMFASMRVGFGGTFEQLQAYLAQELATSTQQA